MVSCQKGPTRHAYAWQIGPFWQDTLDILMNPESRPSTTGIASAQAGVYGSILWSIMRNPSEKSSENWAIRNEYIPSDSLCQNS